MKHALPVLAAIALLAGCGGGNPASKGIVEGLKSEGIQLTSPRPEPVGVFPVTSTAYQLPGGEMHVFPFGSDADAKHAQGQVEPDGSTVMRASGVRQFIDWAAPPHWFRDGPTLAVYVGGSQDVLDALRKVAGQQFAGA